MRLHEFLTEAASDVLYHITLIRNASNILSERRFRLSTSVMNRRERTFQTKNRYYYLSTTRSKLGDYIGQNSYGTALVFKLNGRWFTERYKSFPMDYVSNSRNKAETRSFRSNTIGPEMEDRITSTKPYIYFPENASDAITELHLLVSPVYISSYDQPYVRTIIVESKRLQIPLFIYEDETNFILQNKKKTVKIEDIIPKLSTPRKLPAPLAIHRNARSEDKVKSLRELYYKTDESKLSDNSRELLLKVQALSVGELAGNILQQMDLASEYHRNSLERLLAIFSKEKIRSPKEFAIFLKDKWKDK